MLLTLVVNGTTVTYLLDCLGLSDISNARQLTLITAVHHIEDTKLKAISVLKSDKFLADANWDIVAERTAIDLPIQDDDDDDNMENNVRRVGDKEAF